MESSIKLGRIFGINIGVHWSWAFVLVLVTWSFAEGVMRHFYPGWDTGARWAAGIVIAGVFFLSILAHELAHAVVSNRNGLPVRDITLFLLGGVSNLSKEPPTAAIEFKIAVVGPLTSLALGGVFTLGWLALRPVNHHLAGISANLALINGSLAAFNMLPGFPLDGGRVLRAIVWARGHDHLSATRAAARMGEWIAYGVMGVGAVYVLFGGFVTGIWLFLIGLFLKGAAAASYQAEVQESTLTGVPVSAAMRTDVPEIAPDMSIDELVREHILPRGRRCFAVVVGQILGLVTLTDVRKVMQDAWATTSVYRVMTPADKLVMVSPDQDLEHALRLLVTHDVNQLPVVQGRTLVGMITRADLLAFLRVRENFGAGSRPPGEDPPHRPIGPSIAGPSALSDSPAQYYAGDELLQESRNEHPE